MHADFRAVVGHSWDLDQKRNGMEPILTNWMDNGTTLLKAWCSTLLRAGILYFVPSMPLKQVIWEAKGKKSIHCNGSEENIELILRTIISANQLSIFGAVADLCDELEGNLKHLIIWKRWKFLLNLLSLTLIQTESCRETCCKTMIVNSINYLTTRRYPNCSNAGLSIVEKGQFFITLDAEEGSNELQNLCREKTLPRNQKAARARGWIIGNTKIDSVLDVKVCLHQYRHGVEILIESLFWDGTGSWVPIVNGINTCVSETSEEIPVASVVNCASGRPVAKARPRLKPAVTLSSISVPPLRKWIDINPERFRQDCFVVSKAMIRLLRHDQSVSRGDDGAVRFDDIMKEFKKKFDVALQWPTDDWISILAKGGGPKKRFQYCLNPDSSKHFLFFRQFKDIQEVILLILSCKTMYCCRMTSLSISATSEM